MIRYNAIYLLTALLILSSFKKEQNLAQAWVQQTVLTTDQVREKSGYHLPGKSISLVLLSKEKLLTTSNGNTYLKCFLVNNTDTTASLTRADATIAGFSSEIFKEGKWLSFQQPIHVSCGNSWWTQRLDPKNSLEIHYDHNVSGPVKARFRIKYAHNDLQLYSNEIMIDMNRQTYEEVPAIQ